MRRAPFASLVCCIAVAVGVAACSSDTGPAGGSNRMTGRLVAGATFTCALDHAGAAFCWGAGGSGQLGNGARSESPAPVRVNGGPYSAMSATDNAVCALRFDGGVECWGDLIAQCCGPSVPRASVAVPIPLATSITFSHISVGALTACGLDASHRAFCWGDQSNGALGNGLDTSSIVPPATALAGGLVFASLSEGVFGGCGLDGTGQAWCWGANIFGELGTGDEFSATVASTPVAVSGGLRFTQLSVGAAYVCGVTTTGLTACWGNNIGAALGDGTMTDRSSPTPVVHADFVTVFAGAKNDIVDHTCALDARGAASCWGTNDSGQLGGPSTATCNFGNGVPCSTSPVVVAGGLTFTTLALGNSHTCGMVADGHVYCWGRNDEGELGDGTTTTSATPVLSQFTP